MNDSTYHDEDVIGYSKVSSYTGVFIFCKTLNAGATGTTYYYTQRDAILLAPDDTIDLSYYSGSSLAVYFQVVTISADQSVRLRCHWRRTDGTSSTLSGTSMNITAMFF